MRTKELTEKRALQVATDPNQNTRYPSGVRVVDDVTKSDLLRVFRRDDVALVVPGYYSPADCHLITRRLLDFDAWTTYSTGTGAETIGTLGQSLFGCLGQSLCPGYFESARPMSKVLDRHFRPFEYPTHRLQRELNDVWTPTGVQTLRVNGRLCFSGLCRMFQTGGEALPHDDRADVDFPSPETARIIDQAFANIYVSKTDSGGALQFWNRVINDRTEYERLRYQKTYGLDRALLGPPDIEFDPPLGSLVIASARRVHAVTACAGEGTRLSISTFIDFMGESEPLFFHS